MKNDKTGAPAEGVRERKRRETLQRITQAGISLFIEKGYDAATLDEIAARAGISRRTFFYYFKSKDEILLSAQSGMGEAIVAALLTSAPDKRPLAAIREAVIKVCAPYPTADLIALDRLMRSNATVQARKQANYIQHEQTLFAALRQRWPEAGRETALRLVAMMGISAMRLAFDMLSQEEGRRPIVGLLNETFDALESEL